MNDLKTLKDRIIHTLEQYRDEIAIPAPHDCALVVRLRDDEVERLDELIEEVRKAGVSS